MGCKYLRCGAFVAACGEEEETELSNLTDRADRRVIPYRILSGDEARKEMYQLILPNYNGPRRLISVICETT